MIYCLEDDADIRELELYTLSSIGFEAKGFADGKSFFESVNKDLPELVVLDVMLPDVSGVDVLKRLKSNPKTAALPVIMATARGAEFEKIKALDLGADDYLTKPFSMMEMVARIKAILRRSKVAEDKGEVKFGPIVINEERHSVTLNGDKLELSLKEFELLLLLVKHPGRVYSRDELLNIIWGIDYDGENRTVDVHIRALRSKLEPEDGIIQTVRGIGYKADS
ncbi:MAG: response regulator [Aeromonadales bacterium]|jgi:two-component system, OmpR family, alkaline phosphatase synthesis response regulator PhoP|nr:response regulator [Aeromonadales bacterium]